MAESIFGDSHPDLAWALSNLAETYVAMGRDEEAETRYRQALAMRERYLPPDHPALVETRAGYDDLLRRKSASSN